MTIDPMQTAPTLGELEHLLMDIGQLIVLLDEMHTDCCDKLALAIHALHDAEAETETGDDE